MKITRKQLKELISEQINNKKESPELQKIAKEIAINVGQQINQKVKKNPRITLWSPRSAAVLRYLRKTSPEFSISKEASLLIDNLIKVKYQDIWNLFNDLD